MLSVVGGMYLEIVGSERPLRTTKRRPIGMRMTLILTAIPRKQLT